MLSMLKRIRSIMSRQWKAVISTAVLLLFLFIALSIWNRPPPMPTLDEGLGISDLIARVRQELAESEKRRINEEKAALFNVKSFDLEIGFVVRAQRTEKGGVEYRFVAVEGESTLSSERIQRVMLHMQAVEPRKGSVSESAAFDTTGGKEHDPPPAAVHRKNDTGPEKQP